MVIVIGLSNDSRQDSTSMAPAKVLVILLRTHVDSKIHKILRMDVVFY